MGAHSDILPAGPPLAPAGFSAVDLAVARLDAWLDTMRGPGGYGGPVVHWWQQSLVYTGPGLDWRYEGLIDGYLQLWRRSGDERWLAKARRAADDLVAGQQPDGHYPASAFEINPATAGTPHEAACDAGLLLLALALREAGRAGWERYAACARRNMQRFYLEQLWDGATQSFRDSPLAPSFVPNKAATACEALFLLAAIEGEAGWVERYALPTLRRIVAHQVRDRGPLDGAIAQNSFGERRVETFFPIYTARCVPALLQGYRWTNDERYADCALRAMAWIVSRLDGDGALPTAVYRNGRVNRYPAWVAPLGDVLRAAEALRPYGMEAGLEATMQWLLSGQDASGGIQTARGFRAQAGGRAGGLPDVRDIMHVAGWCDKAFRYLASLTGPALPVGRSETFQANCVLRGQVLQLSETPEGLEIAGQRGARYRWRKGQPWPDVASKEFWLR